MPQQQDRLAATVRKLYTALSVNGRWAGWPLTYDGWGRLIKQTYQRGSDAPKVYDLRYNDKDVLVRLERDGTVLWNASQKDAARRLRIATLGNGLILNHGFNAYSARLRSTDLNKGDNTSMLQLGYDYDTLGNLSARTQYWDPKVGESRVGFTEVFYYDELNRLKSSQVDGKALQEFTYDAAGNITSKTGLGVYSYATAGANAVQSVGTLGAFFYDDNGNLTSGAGRTIDWASFDMPVKISNASAWASFAFGPEHQRTRQDRSDGVTIVYAGAQEVEWANGQVTSIKTFWPMGIGFEVDKPEVATKLYWTHTDRLGSTIAYSTSAGELESERLAYDAWGKRRTADGSATPNTLDGVIDSRGYTEHEMLDQLDLVHMNGRVYDPLTGRFLSPDPVIPDPDDGQSHNRYSYVRNNPTNLTDPSGYTEVCSNPPCTIEITGKRLPSWWDNPTPWLLQQSQIASAQANMVWGRAVAGVNEISRLQKRGEAVKERAIGRFPKPLRWALAMRKYAAAGGLAVLVAKIAAEKVADVAIGAMSNEETPASDDGTSGTNSGDKKAGDKDPSTPTGQSGSPMDVPKGTNEPANIGGRDYTGHALDQSQGRGVTPTVVEDAITTGTARPDEKYPDTRTEHTSQDGRIRVITDKESGRVITVIPK